MATGLRRYAVGRYAVTRSSATWLRVIMLHCGLCLLVGLYVQRFLDVSEVFI